MSVFIEIYQLWTRFHADPVVTEVISHVCEDEKKKDVDLMKSTKALTSRYMFVNMDQISFGDKRMHSTRKKFLKILKTIYYCRQQIPVEWMYYHKVCLRKLILASTVLESIHMRSKSDKPTTENISYCLVGLAEFLDQQYQAFKILSDIHVINCTSQKGLVQVHTIEYKSLSQSV